MKTDVTHWVTIVLLAIVLLLSFSCIEQRNRVLVQHVLQILLVLWLIVSLQSHNGSYGVTIWTF